MSTYSVYYDVYNTKRKQVEDFGNHKVNADTPDEAGKKVLEELNKQWPSCKCSINQVFVTGRG